MGQTLQQAADDAFPEHGIRLSYLTNDFIERCGGREQLKGLSIQQVCDTFIKRFTASSQSSYCDMLAQEKHPSIAPAEVFLSHAWKYTFLDVVAALAAHFAKEPEKVIWFDLFTNNQHIRSNKPFDFWENTLKSAIGKLGHTVMVLSPWNNPIPYTRAWCVFEAYATAATGARFEIAMSRDHRSQFLDDVAHDPVLVISEMLGKIDAERSECSVAADKEPIFAVIRKTVGFRRINEMLHEQLREWIVSVAKDAVKSNTDDRKRPSLLNILACVYQTQGKYPEAQKLHEECLQLNNTLLGPTHRVTLRDLSNLAVDLLYQQHIDEALRRHQECLAMRRNVLGKNDAETLRSVNNVAVCLDKKGKYRDAKKLHEECYMMRTEVLGGDHSDTLDSLFNLASIARKEGNVQISLQLQEECLQRRAKVFGKKHPRTLMSMFYIGITQYQSGDITGALKLHEECLELRREVLGSHHGSTVDYMQCLGNYLQELGRYKRAKELFEESLIVRTKMLGPKHVQTLSARYNLANLMMASGKLEIAERMHSKCFELRKEVIGLHHSDTLNSLQNLCCTLLRQERYAEALPLREECYRISKVLYGAEHQKTIEHHRNLQLVKKKLG